MDFYQVLGVGRDATPDQIKAAFRKLAAVWHPDKRPSNEKEESEKKFKLISDAYDTLYDVLKRSAYDQRNPPRTKVTKVNTNGTSSNSKKPEPRYTPFMYMVDMPEPKVDLWGEPIKPKSKSEEFKDSYAGKYESNFGMPAIRRK